MPKVYNSPLKKTSDKMLPESKLKPLDTSDPLVESFAKKTQSVPPKKKLPEHDPLLHPLVGNERKDRNSDYFDMLLDNALAKDATKNRSSNSEEAGQKGKKNEASQVHEAHRSVQFFKPTHPAQRRVARLMTVVDKATKPDATDYGAAARYHKERSGQIRSGSSNHDYQWASPLAQAKVDKIVGAFTMPLCGAEECLLHRTARRAPEKAHQTNLRQEVWLQELSKMKAAAPLVKNPAPRRAPSQVGMIRSKPREMQISHTADQEWKNAIQARLTRVENDMAAAQMWQSIMSKGVDEVMEAVFQVTHQMTQLAQFCAARSENNQTLHNQTLQEPKQEESKENKENTPPFGTNSTSTF